MLDLQPVTFRQTQNQWRNNMMQQIVTIKEAVKRATADQLPVSEYTLRRWIKTKQIPVRMAGTKTLLYYPNLVRYLTCVEDHSTNK